MPKTALYNMEGAAIGEVELSDAIFAAPVNVAAMHLVVRAILNLCAAFGTPLVAEGVEEAEELAVLRDLGCHFGQGYLFGRPQPVDTIREDEIAA